LTELPPTLENLLCFDRHLDKGYHAYTIERGSYGRIKRKESWHAPQEDLWASYWVMFQMSHIIPYDQADWGDTCYDLRKLLSAVTYSNYTRRRGGLPNDDAIPTGGQLVRIAKVGYNASLSTYLVWSSQNFVEGEHEAVCRTPHFGPRRKMWTYVHTSEDVEWGIYDSDKEGA